MFKVPRRWSLSRMALGVREGTSTRLQRMLSKHSQYFGIRVGTTLSNESQSTVHVCACTTGRHLDVRAIQTTPADKVTVSELKLRADMVLHFVVDCERG